MTTEGSFLLGSARDAKRSDRDGAGGYREPSVEYHAVLMSRFICLIGRGSLAIAPTGKGYLIAAYGGEDVTAGLLRGKTGVAGVFQQGI